MDRGLCPSELSGLEMASDSASLTEVNDIMAAAEQEQVYSRKGLRR